MQYLELTRPDDWHAHLRDGPALARTVPDLVRTFARAIVMPNLVPPVTTTADALAYRERILAALPEGARFTPLMTLYLTDNTTPEEIRRAQASGAVFAAKLYPAGATTNSASGVTDLGRIYPALEAMQAAGMLLLVHGEVTDAEIDIFDRERVFIERHLTRLLRDFPALKIVLEHITTRDAADFVANGPDNLAATITPQHLLYNRNHLLVGGIRPHLFCLPILKRNIHQQALIELATSGHPRVFLGTDSAPHARSAKENACGCAGCYSAPAALELYAEVFARANALDRLEAFAAFNGPDFYGLPRNKERVVLERREWTVPERLPYGDGEIVPLNAGQQLGWKLVPQD